MATAPATPKPSAQSCSMNFIPSGATKYAWDHKRFATIHRLDDLVEQLKVFDKSRLRFRGHISLAASTPKADKISPYSFVMEDEICVPFTAYFVLRELLDHYNVLGIPPSAVKSISIYGEGYYVR